MVKWAVLNNKKEKNSSFDEASLTLERRNLWPHAFLLLPALMNGFDALFRQLGMFRFPSDDALDLGPIKRCRMLGHELARLLLPLKQRKANDTDVLTICGVKTGVVICGTLFSSINGHFSK